ncbi:hypothetical protein [Aeromonas hydrophila]|nr:hypothetical protein [Aeromonas hydrophila]
MATINAYLYWTLTPTNRGSTFVATEQAARMAVNPHVEGGTLITP